MNLISTFFKNKKTRILLVILLIGILITLIPIFTAKPQCPNQPTQDCIIGADIGSGLIWILGYSVIAVAVIGLCINFIASIQTNLSRLAVGLILVGAFLLIMGYISAPLLNSNEIYKAAKCNANDRSSIKEMNAEYCEFPKRSPQADIDYFNNIVVTGALLLFGGISISTYSLMKRKV